MSRLWLGNLILSVLNIIAACIMSRHNLYVSGTNILIGLFGLSYCCFNSPWRKPRAKPERQVIASFQTTIEKGTDGKWG